MARKKSLKTSARKFRDATAEIEEFLPDACDGLSKKQQSWCYDYAVIRLYRNFENLMLECLVGALNNDTGTLTAKTGFKFPEHLTDEVCEFIVTGDGYFDFRGRDGLIKILRRYLPSDHYLVEVVKKTKYKKTIERLTTLRNYAAHKSTHGKRQVLQAIDQKQLRSAGSWLKSQKRFPKLVKSLDELATELEAEAPY